MKGLTSRTDNVINLLILFVGGYVVTVLLSWAVLLIDYATKEVGNSSALSVLTPAGVILIGGLLGLASPFFFFVPISAIVAFSVLAVETPKPKKLVVGICATIFVGSQTLILVFWGDRAIMLLTSSFALCLWLSIGLILVKVFRRFRSRKVTLAEA